jgi:hypothetical protein
MLATVMQQETENQNQSLRDFAARYVSVFRPSLVEAIAAVKPYFPEAIGDGLRPALGDRASVDDILAAIGIIVIVDIGKGYRPMRLSWSIASSDEEAQEQRQNYSEEKFEKNP